MRSPVILIGMHRSGTSLVARLLQRMGLFLGWELDANAEAVFFVLRNQALLEAQGGSWDQPEPVELLLREEHLRALVIDALRRELRLPGRVSYLGPLRWWRYRSLMELDFPWGWKDPRNTLLLPLWLEVFPQATVVHVVRNGVDVALSLAAREERRLSRLLSSGSARRLRDAPVRVPAGTSRLGWWWSQTRLRLGSDGVRRRLRKVRIHPSIEPERGFSLWEDYLARAASAASSLGGRLLEIRYEDLVDEPAAHLPRLAEHCGLPAPAEELSGLIAAKGRFRFQGDAEGRAFYETVRRTRWMRRWGYDDVG